MTGGGTAGGGWESLDWRTGETIACGNDSVEDYAVATDRLDPDERWVHIDHVGPGAVPLPLTAGVPEGLSEALDSWVSYRGTPDEEIADFVGWPVSKVREHRAEPAAD